MALIEFKRGMQANLPATADDGVFYLTEDTNRLYAGIGEDKAPQLLNQTVQIVEKVDSLPETATVNDFYYCSAENVLAIYTIAGWVQINPDTGAIGVEVTGEGNAVTNVSYDAKNRKLTYTLGDTFATAEEVDNLAEELNNFKEYVGTYPTDKDENDNPKYTSVIDYVIKVASGGSESAASVQKELDDYKKLNDQAVESAAEIANAAQATANEANEAIGDINETLAKIANPMIYKGVVNSEAELLSKENEPGYTYMVGTSGIYEDKAAELGDLFIGDGEGWTYIPAGDDAHIDTQYRFEVYADGSINLISSTNPAASTSTLKLVSDSLEVRIENSNSVAINLQWGTF